MIQPNILTANIIYLLDSSAVMYLLGIEIISGVPHLTQTVVTPVGPANPVYLVDSSTAQTYLLGITTSGQLTLTVHASVPQQTSQLLLGESGGDFFIIKVFNAEFDIIPAPPQPRSVATPSTQPSSTGQIIPLDNSPNQTWQVSLSINGGVQTFFVTLDYNEIAGYWVMQIQDNNQNPLLTDVPLITGLDLLRQYQYLGIGSLYIVNTEALGGTPDSADGPDNTNLGTTYKMVWSDNTVLPVAA